MANPVLEVGDITFTAGTTTKAILVQIDHGVNLGWLLNSSAKVMSKGLREYVSRRTPFRYETTLLCGWCRSEALGIGSLLWHFCSRPNARTGRLFMVAEYSEVRLVVNFDERRKHARFAPRALAVADWLDMARALVDMAQLENPTPPAPTV